MGVILKSARPSNITTARLESIIDEWVFSKRNRLILKRKLLDEDTYEKIAEEFDMSVEQIKRIVKRDSETLKRHF